MAIQVWFCGEYKTGFPAAWAVYRHFKKHKPLEKLVYKTFHVILPPYELTDVIYLIGNAFPPTPLPKHKNIATRNGFDLATTVWNYFSQENVPLLLRYCSNREHLAAIDSVKRYIGIHPVSFEPWDRLYTLFETDLNRVIDRAQAIQQYINYTQEHQTNV